VQGDDGWTGADVLVEEAGAVDGIEVRHAQAPVSAAA
jgi:hypothetical protein